MMNNKTIYYSIVDITTNRKDFDRMYTTFIITLEYNHKMATFMMTDNVNTFNGTLKPLFDNIMCKEEILEIEDKEKQLKKLKALSRLEILLGCTLNDRMDLEELNEYKFIKAGIR